jgi:hypothetical protein
MRGSGRNGGTSIRIAVFVVSVFLLAAATGIGSRVAADDKSSGCEPVGGGILTNFLDSSETLGTATGDLAGGLGVVVLGVSSGANGTTVYHVHHHWVTVSGDTILFNDAYLTAFPTGDSGKVLGDYLNGVTISGGTGRFANATGTLAAFGAVDLNKGLLTLRYQGKVCLQPESD